MENREIKFRAWHIAEGKMCDVELISFKMNGAFLIGVVPAPDQRCDRFTIESPKEGRFCDNAEFKLMLWTGLKDKNGVDIYEGDIIKARWGPGVVGFGSGAYNIGGWAISLFKKEHEVIGNIYQHPNLIKL